MINSKQKKRRQIFELEHAAVCNNANILYFYYFFKISLQQWARFRSSNFFIIFNFSKKIQKYLPNTQVSSLTHCKGGAIVASEL